MRPPVDTIPAPPFPAKAPWINVATLRMDRQQGRPVLIEFWDFCRPNSMRTLPYFKAWHERYADAGLRVIGVHASGFEPSADTDSVRAAVARLGIEYPVMVDVDLELWQEYENLGWPARYLFNAQGALHDFHYGEGAYAETEQAIQELLGLSGQPTVEPQRPEDVPGAVLTPQTEDVQGPYSGPYEAGGVWAVVDGAGVLEVNGEPVEVPGPGAHELIRHETSQAGTLELSAGPGVSVLATCFTPGVNPAG
ncbi:MAG: redoxin domain-containing protein [Solirubrobacterales bacterium]|nr:redoxin domain-containing protein [Solirubrobacterales bacterium]